MNRGFTIVEILVSCLILGIVTMGAGAVFIQMTSLQNKTNVKESSMATRSNLIGLFKNEYAMKQIIAKNSSMTCLRTIPSSCTTTSTGQLNVYNSDGTLYFASLSPTAGFTKDGNPCNNYSATSNCSLRYQISWKALCGADCSAPQISISGIFQAQQKEFPINLVNYNFEVVVPHFTDSLWIRCAEKGKFFLPAGMNSFAADADGCIDPNAFKGADGPQGPPGPPGPPAICPVCS